MKENVVLKSANPAQYGDLVIECRVIRNCEITEYLTNIPETRKFVAYKSGKILARKGNVGERVKTVLITNVDGRDYVLSEEEGTVKKRTYQSNGEEISEADYVVTNVSSTSNEEYIVPAAKIDPTSPKTTYDIVETNGGTLTCIPKYDPRVLTEVDENVIIETAWGSKAVCLKGGFIVTYDADTNDYNVLERGAFESTYVVDNPYSKVRKRS